MNPFEETLEAARKQVGRGNCISKGNAEQTPVVMNLWQLQKLMAVVEAAKQIGCQKWGHFCTMFGARQLENALDELEES